MFKPISKEDKEELEERHKADKEYIQKLKEEIDNIQKEINENKNKIKCMQNESNEELTNIMEKFRVLDRLQQQPILATTSGVFTTLLQRPIEKDKKDVVHLLLSTGYERVEQGIESLSLLEQIRFYTDSSNNYCLAAEQAWEISRPCYTFYSKAIDYLHKVKQLACSQPLNTQLMLSNITATAKLHYIQFIAFLYLRIDYLKNCYVPLEKLDFLTLTHYLQELLSLANKLLKEKDYLSNKMEFLRKLYHSLAPWIEHYLDQFHHALNRAKRQVEEKRLEALETILGKAKPLMECWAAHEQNNYVRQAIEYVYENLAQKVPHYNCKQWIIPLKEWIEKSGWEQLPNPYLLRIISHLSLVDSSQTLNKLRADFKRMIENEENNENDAEKIIQTQTIFRQGVLNWLQECIQEQIIWQEPPCEFVILGLDSLGGGHFSLVSDVNIALLVAEEKYSEHPYFRHLIQGVQLHLECSDRYCRISNISLRHLGVNQEGGSLGTDHDYIHTPQSLAQLFSSPSWVRPLEYDALLRPIVVYTSRHGRFLFSQYQKELMKNLNSISASRIFSKNSEQKGWEEKQQHFTPLHQQWGHTYLRLHQSKEYNSKPTKADRIDLKQEYWLPFLLWCQDVALYFGIGLKEGLEADIIKIVEQLAAARVVSRSWLKESKRIISELQYLRLKQQATWLSLSVSAQLQIAQDEFLLPDVKITTALQLPLITEENKEEVHRMVQALQLTQKEYLQLQRIHAWLIELPTLTQLIEQTSTVLVRRSICYQTEVFVWQRVLSSKLTEPYSSNPDEQTQLYLQQRAHIEWRDKKGKSYQGALLPAIQKQLFHPNGRLRQEERNPMFGRRLVIEVYEKEKEQKEPSKEPLAYWKFFPEMPGVQMQVAALQQYLSGYGLHCTLVKLYHPLHPMAIPVLVSRPAGCSFKWLAHQAGEIHNPNLLRNIEQNLDPRSFSLKFLESVVAAYEDDQAGNISAEVYNAEEKEKPATYRLVGIDSDHAFQSPLLISYLKSEVNLKSLVYCMDEMNKPLDKAAVEEFLAVNVNEVLHKVLEAAACYEESYIKGQNKDEGLFTREELIIYYEHKHPAQTKIDTCKLSADFDQGAIARLYWKLESLQALLQDVKKRKFPIHLEVLRLIEPDIADSYEEALKEKELSCIERLLKVMKLFNNKPKEKLAFFDKVSALNVQQALSCSSSKVLLHAKENDVTYLRSYSKKQKIEGWKNELKRAHENFQDFPKITAIRQAIEQGNLKDFEVLRQQSNTDVLIGRILSQIRIKELAKYIQPLAKRKAYQQQLLQIAQRYRLTKLHLAGWEGIEDNILKLLCYAPSKWYEFWKPRIELRYLNVSGCLQLTEGIFSHIAKYCPNLEVLDGRNLMQLQRLGIKEHSLQFKNLKRLRLEGCKNLTEVFLKTLVLEDIRFKGADKLKILSTQNPSFKGLEDIISKNRNNKIIPIKLFILGNDMNSGKSSLLLHFSNDPYPYNKSSIETLGIDYRSKTINKNNREIKVEIFTTAGQERFRTITANYCKGADGFIICVNLTEEFYELERKLLYFYEIIFQDGRKNVPIVLALTHSSSLNNSDFLYNKEIPQNSLQVAKNYNLPCYLFLANTGEGAKEIFEAIIQLTISVQVTHNERINNQRLLTKEILTQLILKEKNEMGDTFLLQMAKTNQLGTLRWLFTEGGDVSINETDNEGNTALLQAAKRYDWKMVQWLVKEAHAAIDQANHKGYTILLWAIWQNNLPMVQWLVKEGGASLQASSPNRSPLLSAAHEGYLEIVKWLIQEAEVPIDQADDNGDTALLLAVVRGDISMVKWLIKEGGSEINQSNKKNHTALILAKAREDQSMVDWLIQEGATEILEKFKFAEIKEEKSFSFFNSEKITQPNLLFFPSILSVEIKNPSFNLEIKSASFNNKQNFSLKKRKLVDKKKEEKNYYEIDIPGDGTCLFYSVMFSFLLPVIEEKEIFANRFSQLFGNENMAVDAAEHLRNLLEIYQGEVNFIKQHANELEVLVDVSFRQRVGNYMRFHANDFQAYIQGDFNTYLNRMSQPKTWGDEPEIQAISRMLECRISVFREDQGQLSIPRIYGEEFSTQFYLVYTSLSGSNEQKNHYHYLLEERWMNLQPEDMEKNTPNPHIFFESKQQNLESEEKFSRDTEDAIEKLTTKLSQLEEERKSIIDLMGTGLNAKLEKQLEKIEKELKEVKEERENLLRRQLKIS